MEKEKLNHELDKIHEEGDEMFIPNSIMEEVFRLAIEREIKNCRE